MIKRILHRTLDLLYPHTCPFCGQVSKEEICSACSKKLVYVKEPRCKRCSKPLLREEQEYCYDCTHVRHHFDRGFSLWLHQSVVPKSIYQFKYHNRRIFAIFYARELWNHYHEKISRWAIDLIIPIPLHKHRKRERGFNQAELIAKEISGYIDAPVLSGVLFRTSNTKRQKNLSVRERKANLNQAFVVSEKFQSATSVLLVDDIYTTGSTLDEAAKVLKRAGVEKVYFLTISIGQGY